MSKAMTPESLYCPACFGVTAYTTDCTDRVYRCRHCKTGLLPLTQDVANLICFKIANAGPLAAPVGRRDN